MSWRPGTLLLDTYEVIGDLGSGGMATVIHVAHREWGIELAVKTPHAEIVASAEGLSDFVREAETWVDLGLHPNVVSCFYVRTVDTIPRVFIEYLAGGSLADAITTGALRAGGWERLLDVVIQVAWGLKHAHLHRLVHQDVKPGNIMLTSAWEAKVTDFGLAKASERGISSTRAARVGVTTQGMTREYASPEQLDRKHVTAKSDMFSWAVTVLEMVVGDRTWMIGPAAAEVLEELPPQSMPPSLRSLLRQCLSDDPAARPANMDAIVQTLSSVYLDVVGSRYRRSAPRTSTTADDLNNRALAMLDLGRRDEAMKLFDDALHADPRHAAATYNRGLAEWRSGKIRDDQLLSTVRSVAADATEIERRIGWVHVERADVEEAAKSLATDARFRAVRSRSDVGALSDQVTEWPSTSEKANIEGVAITARGERFFIGRRDGAVEIWDVESKTFIRRLGGGYEYASAPAIDGEGRIVAVPVARDKQHRVEIWDAASARRLTSFENNEESITGVALSVDGAILVAGGHSAPARVWDVKTGKCLYTLPGHKLRAHAVACSADGSFVVTGGDDEVFLWDGPTRRGELPGHKGLVRCVQVTRDGKRIVTLCDETVRVWDAATKTLRWEHRIAGEGWTPSVLALSPDGKWVAHADGSHGYRIWDVDSGRCLRTHRFEGSWLWQGLALSSSPRLVCMDQKRIVCVELASAPLPAPPWFAKPQRAEEAGAAQVAFDEMLGRAGSHEARHELDLAIRELGEARRIHGFERANAALIFAGKLGRRTQRGRFIGGLPLGEAKVGEKEIAGLKVAVDDRSLFSIDGDGTLVQLTLPDMRTTRTTPTTLPVVGPLKIGSSLVRGLDISCDARVALVATSEGHFSFWDTQAGTLLQRVDRAITVDGREVDLASCKDEPAFTSFMPYGDSRVMFEGLLTSRTFHALPYSEPRLSPRGDHAFMRGHDDRVRIWRRGEYVPILTGRDERDSFYREVLVPRSRNKTQFDTDTNSLRLIGNHGQCFTTSDFHHGVTASTGGFIQLWDLRTLQMRSYRLHRGVTAVGCDSSGTILGATDVDGIRFWRRDSDPPAKAISDGANHLLVIGSHGTLAASGGADGRVFLWDVANGCVIGTLDGQAEPIKCIALSVDQQFVATGSAHGRVRVWSLEWELSAPIAPWDLRASALVSLFVSAYPPTWKKPWFAAAVPTYDPEQQAVLLDLLARSGFGWLDRERLWAEVKHMAEERFPRSQ